ncbi:MAG: ABC transporter substrate-binding protein [Sphingomonas sp.]
MTQNLLIGRRGFLAGAAAASTLALPAFARGERHSVRIASNQAAENATLQQLIADRGYFERLSLDTEIVEGKTISAPMDAILSGAADICMISAFVGFLPAIEAGKELRLVGAAMQLPALALYATDPGLMRVGDLAGKRVGIGGTKGLLHILSIALLRKKGVDPAKVEFVNVGSNAAVFDAVATGKVDAGLSGIAGMADARAHVVEDGRLWKALPEYTYQPAYASVKALREKPEAIARCLAAYTQLWRYLATTGSREPYLAARQRVAGATSVAEGQSVWDFIHREHPYSAHPGVSPKRVAFLQQLNVEVGLQSKVLPFAQVADMGPAIRANRLIR